MRWINFCALEFCPKRAKGHGTIVKYRLGFRAAWQSRSVGYAAFKGGVITLIQPKYPVPERPWLAGGGRA